jgi:hypothetical protein
VDGVISLDPVLFYVLHWSLSNFDTYTVYVQTESSAKSVVYTGVLIVTHDPVFAQVCAWNGFFFSFVCLTSV